MSENVDAIMKMMVSLLAHTVKPKDFVVTDPKFNRDHVDGKANKDKIYYGRSIGCVRLILRCTQTLCHAYVRFKEK